MTDTSKGPHDITAANRVTASGPTKTHFPEDHPQEMLRRALWEAHQSRISFKSIRWLCLRLRPNWEMSDKAIRDFVVGETKAVEEQNREALANFWLHSPQGRALRSFDISTSPKFSEVIGLLASGRATLNSRRDWARRYFMYHGSYLKEDHYVIRVIDIESTDGSTLVVTDSINDTVSLGRGTLVAYGALVFVREQPQILLSNDENKVGFSLFIGSESGPKIGEMDYALGAFIAITPHDDLIYRRALLRRSPDGNAADMIQQSGIFTLNQLKETQRRDHLEAFQQLARHEPKTIFQDPITKLTTN